jgi:hypothetical protein
MAQEYFIACDEDGLHLFGSKPHLERKVARPIHWHWVDEEGKYGWPIGIGGPGNFSITKKIRNIPFNSYIKLIDFGEDVVFSPLRQIEHERFIKNG